MIDENLLKDYMRRKFQVIYDHVGAIVVIYIINIITILWCCSITCCDSGLNYHNIFDSPLIIYGIGVDICVSCVAWRFM